MDSGALDGEKIPALFCVPPLCSSRVRCAGIPGGLGMDPASAAIPRVVFLDPIPVLAFPAWLFYGFSLSWHSQGGFYGSNPCSAIPGWIFMDPSPSGIPRVVFMDPLSPSGIPGVYFMDPLSPSGIPGVDFHGSIPLWHSQSGFYGSIPLWHSWGVFHGSIIPLWHSQGGFYGSIPLWHSWGVFHGSIPLWHSQGGFYGSIPLWHSWGVFHGSIIPLWHSQGGFYGSIPLWHSQLSHPHPAAGPSPPPLFQSPIPLSLPRAPLGHMNSVNPVCHRAWEGKNLWKTGRAQLGGLGRAGGRLCK
ncbi:uncharacterized protein LOC120411263 isoform X3 [Corvus cornix cornix]|uniref:uncharacterized protein LOC120411263 isoform X3 n=1 Tax=Corvus cornix cornix TaxID=932674 RepID=UPI00194F1D1C|nr:uncharacterized protein LOC120411263 isoform X3 [Corvus cornix cornix]